jgi:hypothetical protein
MKKINLLLSLLLVSMVLTPLASAFSLNDPVNFNVSGITNWISGNIFGLASTDTWVMLITVVLVFIVFLFAFYDIFYGFTAFSRITCWIIAFAIAFIGSITKGTLYVAKFFLILSAWAGTFTIFIVILLAFVAFAGMHLFAGKWLAKIRNAKSQGQIDKQVGLVTTGIRGMKEVGRELRNKKKWTPAAEAE